MNGIRPATLALLLVVCGCERNERVQERDRDDQARTGAPRGVKGVHVHEKGDCSNIEGESVGKHFAPRGEKHGLPGSPEHHLGDLGNITIDEQGKGRLEIMVAGANLEENDPRSFLGKAIAVHAAKDTGAQPSGASGKPIACAVIEKE